MRVATDGHRETEQQGSLGSSGRYRAVRSKDVPPS